MEESHDIEKYKDHKSYSAWGKSTSGDLDIVEEAISTFISAHVGTLDTEEVFKRGHKKQKHKSMKYSNKLEDNVDFLYFDPDSFVLFNLALHRAWKLVRGKHIQNIDTAMEIL